MNWITTLSLDIRYYIYYAMLWTVYVWHENYLTRRNNIVTNPARAIPAAAPSIAMVVRSRRRTTTWRELNRSRSASFQAANSSVGVRDGRDASRREIGGVIAAGMDGASGGRGKFSGWDILVADAAKESVDDSASRETDELWSCDMDVMGAGWWLVVSRAGSEGGGGVPGVGVAVSFPAPMGPSRSKASMTLSSNPFTSLFLRHGSTPIWKTRKSSTLTPIKPHVPHVLMRRILSLHICSSWYRAKILALSFAVASSACLSAAARRSWAEDSDCSLAWSDRYRAVKRSKSFGVQACFRCNSSLTSRCEAERWLIALE